jgi:molybdopterin-guanine dinucleotide biosynthesis protein A
MDWSIWSPDTKIRLMNSTEGFILVGGQSRRMGTDKSRLVLAGQTFVERIAVELSAATSLVTIVGGSPVLKTENSKLKTVPDVVPNWGALGGVHAALSVCRSEWALIVGCDFPLVTGELFVRLLSLRDDFEAVVPIQSDGIPQPLCALYRRAPCLRLAEQLIKTGERKPIALLQSAQTRWLSFGELANLAAADHFFDNINTPEDYARVSGEGVDTGMQR